MRVDASQLLAQGGFKIKAGSGTANTLKVGDTVRATVMSSDKNGAISLKMENGDSFNAKMGADVKLLPGDTILLEVTSQEKGVLTLAFGGIETADEEFPAVQTNVVRDFDDKSLEPYARKLSELNIPVTEKTAVLMKEILAQNPGMSFDEAAFLASNKIVDDPQLMKAAIEMLAGRGNLDELIMKLIAEIKENNTLTDLELGVRNPELANESSDLPNAFPSGGSGLGQVASNQGGATPLTDLIALLVKNAPGLLAGIGQSEGQSEMQNAEATQKIITQTYGNMQINAENVENFSQTIDKLEMPGNAKEGVHVAAQGEQADVVLAGKNGADVILVEKNENTPIISQNNNAPPVGTAQSSEIAAPISTQITEIATSEAAQTAANPAIVATEAGANQTIAPSMTDVVTQLLADIPEFSDTPRSALEQFSNMLLRIAGDNMEQANNSEALISQLEKLFTRISLQDPNAGERLMNAKAELYTRLALIEEAMSGAAHSVRAELMDSTHRLMNQVRVFNSIEQFAYVQLPIQLADEQKVADLYVFKRKSNKKGDKESVNILLAIDLQFMGHWEALINVKGKSVSINMEVPGPAEKEHFSENTVLLHRLLDEADFKLVSTNITFTEVETTPLTALSTLDKYTGNKQGTIDFKI